MPRINLNRLRSLFIVAWLIGASGGAPASPKVELTVSSLVWEEFNIDERVAILRKFPGIMVMPKESIGVIQGAQVINRSVDGSNSGAVLGSTFAQAAYIDRSIDRGNYSTKNQLGAAIIGGVLGSSLDTPGARKYVLSYGVRTLDGQVRRIEVSSSDETHQPLGQCVKFPEVEMVDVNLCNDSKVSFLRRLSVIGGAPEDAGVIGEKTGSSIKCQVPNVGMIMLDKYVCLQMEGKVEK